MDEELHFIMENFDLSPEFSDELVTDYFYNRRGFMYLILIQYFMQLYLALLTLNSQSLILYRFNQLYQYDMEKMRNFFAVSVGFDFVINSVAFALALKAYAHHQIKFYKYFSLLYAACIISRVMLSYLNSWNVVMFVLMMFTYTYSRYMIALIYGLCLIPNINPPPAADSHDEEPVQEV
mmetsp:Transcript_6809/g.5065  ORF Transcript_6809/g.5065 Transcript_6809/m.5065 type:complete len:179 (-) Transcript_6809:42-578(-)